MRRDIGELASRLVTLQKEARSLGIFPGDREMLECPQCGLLEDVLAGGRLITYDPGGEGQDSGLRFEDFTENGYRCPSCHSLVEEPQDP